MQFLNKQFFCSRRLYWRKTYILDAIYRLYHDDGLLDNKSNEKARNLKMIYLYKQASFFFLIILWWYHF